MTLEPYFKTTGNVIAKINTVNIMLPPLIYL